MSSLELDRFHDPLYTVAEAARYLGISQSTLARWAFGNTARHLGRETMGAAVVTAGARTRPRTAVIPFVGLAEAYTLTAIRKSGVSLQRIRPALTRLQREVGIEHALASRRLFTDGAEVLYDFAEQSADPALAAATRQLVVVRSGQHVFQDVVMRYLQRIEFGSDGYAQVVPLPSYEIAELVVDARRGFGQPVFVSGGARLEDALGMFLAGEPMDVVSMEYGIPPKQLEDAVRIAARQAA